MAVEVVDLLAPQGPVEVTLFPGENVAGANPPATKLEERLTAYIDQAVVKAGEVAFAQPDDAVRLWALYLTFDAAYVLACTRPANENTMVEVLGSSGYMKDQRDGLREKRDEYRAAYNQMVESLPSEVTTPIGPVSRQTLNVFEW